MALRPFAKHQKKKAEDDTTPSAADEFAQFFSNDPRPEQPETDVNPPAPPEPAPTATMKEGSPAGWYPDSKDPGLMRYWDGFHLTGQTMRVDPLTQPAADRSGAPTPADTATSPSASELLAAGQAKAPLLGSRLLSTADSPPPVADESSTPGGPESSDDESATSLSGERSGGATPSTPLAPSPLAAPTVPPTSSAADAPVATPPPASAISPMGSPQAPPSPAPTTPGWVERTEQAVTRAQSVGTPEAWQEAADAAAVVAEMALTMQVAADVHRSAEQLTEAAGEAKQRAEEAQELATEAQRSVQKTAQAAKEAADAAATAARAATEAKQKAERALETMPRVTARSTDAAQAATAAKRKAEQVEEIVTRAHRADTAEAWRDAHRSAQRTAGEPNHGAQVSGS